MDSCRNVPVAVIKDGWTEGPTATSDHCTLTILSLETWTVHVNVRATAHVLCSTARTWLTQRTQSLSLFPSAVHLMSGNACLQLLGPQDLGPWHLDRCTSFPSPPEEKRGCKNLHCQGVVAKSQSPEPTSGLVPKREHSALSVNCAYSKKIPVRKMWK